MNKLKCDRIQCEMSSVSSSYNISSSSDHRCLYQFEWQSTRFWTYFKLKSMWVGFIWGLKLFVRNVPPFHMIVFWRYFSFSKQWTKWPSEQPYSHTAGIPSTYHIQSVFYVHLAGVIVCLREGWGPNISNSTNTADLRAIISSPSEVMGLDLQPWINMPVLVSF